MSNVNYVKLTNDLCLVQQVVQDVKKQEVYEPCNHIFIYDRSGSMSGSISELCSQLILICKNVPIGDTVTIGWFASEGDYNFILKGFKISDSKDYTILENAINKNNFTKGCTCFSDILFSTETVISDLSIFSKKFCFSFFTDGYPIVNNYKLEEKKIFEAIAKIKGSLHVSMFIGFGTNYNKELLGRMAESLNGVLVHNTDVSEYYPSMINFMSLSNSLNTKIEIDCKDNNALSIFSVTSDGIIMYSPNSSGKLYVNTIKNTDTTIYYISNTEPKNSTRLQSFDTDEVLIQGIYAALTVLVQTVKIDKALEFAGVLGDVNVIDMINNAFTITDYVYVENFLKSAMVDKSKRFISGKDTKYLPKSDVFCAFNIFQLLVDDDDSYFYPQHPNFKYEKIGLSYIRDLDAPKFESFKTAKCRFNNITWNKNKINLSSPSVKIYGELTLKAIDGVTPASMNLPAKIESFIYKVYTLIVNGEPNVKTIYVSSSKSTYETLKANNVVTDDDYNGSGVYGVSIASVPVMNRAMADGNLSANTLCSKVYKELELQAKLKVYKYFNEKFEDSGIVENSVYSEEQQKFLIANGYDVKTGGFSWKSIKADAPQDLDFYEAKCFDIDIENFSSLPKISDVIEKINNPKLDKSGKPKSLTQSQSLIAEHVNVFNSSSFKADPKLIQIEIDKANAELKKVRKEIQQLKFQIILSKKWFEEFTSQVENQIIYKGVKFTFNRSVEKVKY